MPLTKRAIRLGVACSLLLTAQTYTPGPGVLTFFSAVDDTDQPYAIYVPRDYDATRTYPLVISLHGASSSHRLNLRRVFGKGNLIGETDAEAVRYFPRLPDIGYIVASPLARGTLGYQGIPEQDVYDVLADVKKRFSIDEDRVYLTGLSMGGGGALWLGLTRPDVWAAVAPVCAAAPEEARALTPNALHVPVHLFHGSIDPVAPADSSRRWQHDLLAAGDPVEYTEYPNVRHNSWDSAYKNGAIFDWFSKFRRNRFPDRVRFVSDRYRYDRAYWVRLNGITPGTLASIDATFTGPNQVLVTTQNLDGFTLDLGGHPKYSVAKPMLVTIDGVKMKPAKTASFQKTAKGWQPGLYVAPPLSKRSGAEGPAAEAVASRQIYVYGTAGSPTPEELTARREQALQAAEWSSEHSKLLLSFRVVSDKEVRPSDLRDSDLILLGGRETNEQIARLSGRLPLALNISAADYGLVFVYPAGGHYVLINSGLPWWTGGVLDRRGGLTFIPEKLRILQSFQDYILFKGSLENVIVEGRFDRNWKLPPADAARMRDTGAIELD